MNQNINISFLPAIILVNAIENLRKKCVGTSREIIEHTLYQPAQERNTVLGIGWNTP